MKSQALCLVESLGKNIRCDRCDILLDLRTWKNEKIALSKNANKRHGFLCIKCVLSSKVGRTFYRTEEQLNEFVRKI